MKRAPDRLLGWKEIAGYLRVSERTAQRWHAEIDMPVHRLGGQRRAGVYVFREELDDWLAGHDSLQGEASTRIFAAPWPAAVPAVVILAIVTWIVALPMAPTVAEVEISREVKGPGDGYEIKLLRSHKRVVSTLVFANVVTSVALARTESGPIVVAGLGEGPANRRGHIVAVDTNGAERWNLDTFDGQILAEYDKPGHPAFGYLHATDLFATQVGDIQVIAAVIQDPVWSASAVLLVDLRTGRKVAEYWHPGKIGYGRATLVDLDNDGAEELVVPGFNNALQGELVPLAGWGSVVFAVDLDLLAAWGSAQAWPPRWDRLVVRLPRWYIHIPPVPDGSASITKVTVEDVNRDGASDVAVMVEDDRFYYFDGHGRLLRQEPATLWDRRHGVNRELPNPIPITARHLASSHCWRGEVAALSRQLTIAVRAGHTTADEAALWERRCTEIARVENPGDLGMQLLQIWDTAPTVASVPEASPAERAGIMVGDLILQVDGTPVSDGNDFLYEMLRRSAGDRAAITIQRHGQALTLSADLGEVASY